VRELELQRDRLKTAVRQIDDEEDAEVVAQLPRCPLAVQRAAAGERVEKRL